MLLRHLSAFHNSALHKRMKRFSTPLTQPYLLCNLGSKIQACHPTLVSHRLASYICPLPWPQLSLQLLCNPYYKIQVCRPKWACCSFSGRILLWRGNFCHTIHSPDHSMSASHILLSTKGRERLT